MSEKRLSTNNINTSKSKEYTRRDFTKLLGVAAGSLVLPNVLSGCSSNEFATMSDEYYSLGNYKAKIPSKIGGKPVEFIKRGSSIELKTELPEMPHLIIDDISINRSDKNRYHNSSIIFSDGVSHEESLRRALTYYSFMDYPNEHAEDLSTCEVNIDGESYTGYFRSPKKEELIKEEKNSSGFYYDNYVGVRDLEYRVIFTTPNNNFGALRIQAGFDEYAEGISLNDYYNNELGEKFNSIAQSIVKDLHS